MFRRFQSLLSAVTLTSLVFSFIVHAENRVETQIVSNSEQKVETGYGKTPRLFEINRGQTDRQAEFISRGAGYTLYLTKTEAVFSLKTNDAQSPDILRMKLGGANKGATLEASDEAITKTNYYIGKKKFENVSNYRKVNYKKLYDGIDAVFYGNASNQLEYDFTVAPNADADQIELTFDGAENVSIDENGNLVLKTENSELVQQKPFAYQEIDGEKREIASRYVVSANTVKFELGEYDKSKTLVIDPALNYLTYLGGSSSEFVDAVKVDSAGNAYVTGGTDSTNFPGPNSGSGNLDNAVYVSKISPNGQSIIYTTFLDGSKEDGLLRFIIGNLGNDIAVDAAGSAYVSGVTLSDNFPTTANAYQEERYCNRWHGFCDAPHEAFVAKLNPQGTVVYSTYLGGGKTDYANGIVIDSAGKAYVTGGTSSGLTFPRKNQFQSTGVFGVGYEAFITVFNADGSDIVYSSGLGGNRRDDGNNIAIDAANNVYITGTTESDDGTFPIRNGFQSVNRGGNEVFVAKFNTSLSGDASLIYSTLLGGAGTDEGFGIAVDDGNQAYITGITGSFNFPLQNAFRSTNQVNEAFVSVINSTGSALVNSSFLGGENQEVGNDIALGNAGLIYVTGNTLSADFPKALPFQAALAGSRDAFVTKLKFGTGVMSSTFLGGSGFDSGGGIDVRGNHIFVIGDTTSANLATTSGVFQPNPGGSGDGFIAKILDTQIDSVGVFRPQTTFVLTQSTTNIAAQTALSTSSLAGQKGVSGDWDGDGITTLGSFTNGTWKVRNSFVTAVVFGEPIGVKTITFGTTGDLPLVGDWNGDGIETPGVFRPSTAQFTLTDSTAANPSFNFTVTRANFGVAGDLPIAGDFDGDGKDSIAVFRPSTGETFFTNDDVSTKTGLPVTLNPSIDFVAFIGLAGDLPIAGDWNGDGRDSLGVFRPSTTEFFLSDDNINLRPIFLFGQIGDQPFAGDWDGKPNP